MNDTMIDLLDRQEFVDNMINVCEVLSKNKKNMCYAINGSWGIGKSFVLEMFEEQIKVIQNEETATDKYSLFHYNCWHYDYYEEPLVAIVASMLDQIEENENIFSDELKTKAKAILKVIGNGLFTKGVNYVNEKTGIDFQRIIDVYEKGNEISAEELKDKSEFDTYLSFKKTLKALRKVITSLSEEKTIIFVVDELDRCLPEYAIKVLERLHHVFDDIPNVQVIISVDKKQLGNVINQIYGAETDVDKYLAKFIDFELKLDEGSFNDEFDAKFAYYLDYFDYLNSATNIEDIEVFKKNIFTGIDIRTRIKIIDKCNLIHEMLNDNDDKKDYAFMCVEIAFAVMKYWEVDLQESKPSFVISTVFIGRKNDKLHTGMALLNEKVQKRVDGGLYFYSEGDSRGRVKSFVWRNNIWGVILSSYRYVIGYTDDNLMYDDKYKKYGIRNYCTQYRDLLYTIS